MKDFWASVSADGWQFSTYVLYNNTKASSSTGKVGNCLSFSYRPAGLFFPWFGNQCACADYLDHGNRFALVSLVDLRTRFFHESMTLSAATGSRVSQA